MTKFYVVPESGPATGLARPQTLEQAQREAERLGLVGEVLPAEEFRETPIYKDGQRLAKAGDKLLSALAYLRDNNVHIKHTSAFRYIKDQALEPEGVRIKRVLNRIEALDDYLASATEEEIENYNPAQDPDLQ